MIVAVVRATPPSPSITDPEHLELLNNSFDPPTAKAGVVGITPCATGREGLPQLHRTRMVEVRPLAGAIEQDRARHQLCRFHVQNVLHGAAI